MFRPTEKLTDATLIILVFDQIVHDTYSDTCLRLNRTEKEKVKAKLGIVWYSKLGLQTKFSKTFIIQ